MAAKKSTDRDGFELVKKRNKRFRPPRTATQGFQVTQDRAYECPSSQEIVQRVKACRESLKDTAFFSELLDILRRANVPPYKEVICYGIGHIGTSRIAQLQFALLLEMVNSCSHEEPSAWVFDPVLHEQEVMAIEDCGCQLLPRNEVCKRTINHPTLFYMPHCGRAMYNNVLWANWSVQNLTQMALIGNTFSSYQERIPTQQLEKEARYIYRISGVCLEYPLPTSYPDSTVFNDLSLHVFPREHLQRLSHKHWTECPEPPTDSNDPEIITS